MGAAVGHRPRPSGRALNSLTAERATPVAASSAAHLVDIETGRPRLDPWRSSTGSDAPRCRGIGRHRVPSLKAEAGGPARCRKHPLSTARFDLLLVQPGRFGAMPGAQRQFGQRGKVHGKSYATVPLPPLQGSRRPRRPPRAALQQAARWPRFMKRPSGHDARRGLAAAWPVFTAPWTLPRLRVPVTSSSATSRSARGCRIPRIVSDLDLVGRREAVAVDDVALHPVHLARVRQSADVARSATSEAAAVEDGRWKSRSVRPGGAPAGHRPAPRHERSRRLKLVSRGAGRDGFAGRPGARAATLQPLGEAQRAVVP